MSKIKIKYDPLENLSVTATEDLSIWRDLIEFQPPSFARSFEYINGAFYFGLGFEADGIKPDTGRILRVPFI